MSFSCKHLHLTSLGLALAGLAACSGSGGFTGGDDKGGGGGGGGDLNKGSYTKESFEYEDPHPEEFQPLHSAEYHASRRDELAVFRTHVADTGVSLFDDAGQDHARIAGFRDTLLPTGFQPMASGTGQLDREGGDEIALLGPLGPDNLQLVVLAADRSGEWARTESLAIPAPKVFSGGTQRMALADLDNDGRAEFLVTRADHQNNAWLRVFDDPIDGFRLLYNLDLPRVTRIDAKALDADADGKLEIAVYKDGDGEKPALALLDGPAKQFGFRVDWTELVEDYPPQLLVGNFDTDPADEIGTVAVAFDKGKRRAVVRTRELAEDNTFAEIESYTISNDVVGLYFDAAAVDTNRDRRDEIVVPVQYRPGGKKASYRLLHWVTEFDRGPRTGRVAVLAFSGIPRWSRVEAHDADQDGYEEIAHAFGSPNAEAHVLVHAPDLVNDAYRLSTRVVAREPAPRGTVGLVIATGDFDRENLALRSTGQKWIELPDPMPIAVLAAPPTQAGIDQNHDSSQTSYGIARSVQRSHGVTTGWSASYSQGVEVEDITGNFGAAVKATLTWAMSKSLSRSKTETWTKTFAGSYDADVIVFQGTLYHCYEYEIMSAADAKLVGTKITLNDPVATRVYKWTVDYYNENVAERARIGADVTTHEIGRPASYRRRAVAHAVLGTNRGWIDGQGLTVGAVRGGSNSTSVTLSEANSTEKTRSFDAGIEAEVKIAGATYGGSFGVSHEHVYGVTVEESTTYEGVVGDIQNEDQWSDYRYSFGLLVYGHGLDRAGKAQRGKQPYQVVTFWVDDLGRGH